MPLNSHPSSALALFPLALLLFFLSQSLTIAVLHPLIPKETSLPQPHFQLTFFSIPIPFSHKSSSCKIAPKSSKWLLKHVHFLKWPCNKEEKIYFICIYPAHHLSKRGTLNLTWGRMMASSDKWENLLPAPDWPCSLVITSCLLLLQSVWTAIRCFLLSTGCIPSTQICTPRLWEIG